MKNTLFIVLMMTGLVQNSELLSSEQHNEHKKQSRCESYKESFAALAKPQRTVLIQEINQDLADDNSDSDDSTGSGIYFHFGPEHYSVHRELGLMVKTKHLKESAKPKYVNNLEASHDTKKKFKGIILPTNEIKDLLEREKQERSSDAK